MAVKTVMILKGLPASGKSTYAKELVAKHPDKWKHISKDDLRRMLDFGAHSSAREKFICAARDSLILTALMGGYSVIVDDTNFEPMHEQRITDLVAGIPEVVVAVNDSFLSVSPEECIKRNWQRQYPVPERVIWDMYNKYVRPPAPEPPAYNPDLPDAILCDLDGTLAKLNGRDALREQHKCEEDGVDEVVRRLLDNEREASREYGMGGTRVILLSGRSAEYREQTERWLAKHGIEYDALYMRAAGDIRKDRIVKRELHDQYIAGQYNVLYVLDDRNQVVDMWRNELGYKSLQVAEGDF